MKLNKQGKSLIGMKKYEYVLIFSGILDTLVFTVPGVSFQRRRAGVKPAPTPHAFYFFDMY